MPIASQIIESENNFQNNNSDDYTFTAATYQGLQVYDVSKTGVSGFYYETEYDKQGIVLHHTAGTLIGDIPTLMPNNYHVSVPFVIGRNGVIYRLFDPKYWSGHIGAGTGNANNYLSKRTIGIELSNYGYLIHPSAVPSSKNPDSEWLYRKFVNSYYKYCKLSETHFYKKLDSEYRDYEYFATFTQAQYDATRKLVGVLCEEFSIPKVLLPDDTRCEVFSSDEEAKEFKGLSSHVNYRESGKWDLAPHFEWNQVIGFNFPIDLGHGILPTTESVEDYFSKSEKEMEGGYFPLAAYGTWHAGLHIHGNRGDILRSCSRGKIIALRLGETENTVMQSFGSINFILIKTSSSKKTFYFLYNHLDYFTLNESELDSREIKWLKTNSKTVFTINPNKSIEVRTLPGILSQPDSEAIGVIEAGTEIDFISEEADPDGDMWFQVSLPDNVAIEDQPDLESGYIFAAKEQSGVFKRSSVATLDHDVIKAIKNGDIYNCDIHIELGEILWPMGEYGSAKSRRGMVHWEVFSEENLLKFIKDNIEVIDPYDDFNMDSKNIESLIGKELDMGKISNVINFYKNDEDAQKLRSYSCRFVNEWQIKDIDSAVSKLDKTIYKKFGLVDKIKPYVWHKDAIDAGVSIPKRIQVLAF